MKFILSKYKWFIWGDIRVTGYIFYEGRFLRDKELLDFFSGIGTVEALKSRLHNANGQFSVIVDRGSEAWLATDRIRNWPLFYSRIGGQFVVSDDCGRLAGLKEKLSFNEASYNSFLTCGYTLNNLTLVKDIFQVEAGGLTVLTDVAKDIFYYNSSEEESVFRDFPTAVREFREILEITFREYFIALQDRFIALPLSGGYDSRLVALMASEFHPDNVLCYTYGRADNPELKLAEETALRLNLKWMPVIYDEKLIKDFIHDDFFSRYYDWVSDLTGMFFMQEYFSVRHLKQNKLIPDHTVFISGYSGDFIAGSYVTPSLRGTLSQEKLSDHIAKNYFRLVVTDRQTKRDIAGQIAEKIPPGGSNGWRTVESWDMKERHAKFIINSAKVFSFFGYEYIFPFWDNKLVDYMLPLPFDLRNDRRLYEHVLRDCLFAEKNLNLENETNPHPVRKSLQRLKEDVKPYIPRWLRNIFINDYNAISYDIITREFRLDMNSSEIIKPRQSNYYNSYIVQWYLKKCAERYGISGG